MNEDLTLPLMRAQRAAARGKLGWVATLLTASISIIGQLLQVRASDAQKLELISASTNLDTKLDGIRQQLNQLSERITKVEVVVNERTRPGGQSRP